MADNGQGTDTVPTFRPQKYLWLKSKTQIDMLDLDNELMEIPVLIQEASENVAIAMEIRETSKSDLDVQIARSADAIRKTPLESGKAPSETAIDKMVSLTKEYQDKLALLSSARLDAGLWQSITESLRTKSSALRTIADLVSAGWLTTDHVIKNRRRDMRNANQSP